MSGERRGNTKSKVIQLYDPLTQFADNDNCEYYFSSKDLAKVHEDWVGPYYAHNMNLIIRNWHFASAGSLCVKTVEVMPDEEYKSCSTHDVGQTVLMMKRKRRKKKAWGDDDTLCKENPLEGQLYAGPLSDLRKGAKNETVANLSFIDDWHSSYRKLKDVSEELTRQLQRLSKTKIFQEPQEYLPNTTRNKNTMIEQLIEPIDVPAGTKTYKMDGDIACSDGKEGINTQQIVFHVDSVMEIDHELYLVESQPCGQTLLLIGAKDVMNILSKADRKQEADLIDKLMDDEAFAKKVVDGKWLDLILGE